MHTCPSKDGCPICDRPVLASDRTRNSAIRQARQAITDARNRQRATLAQAQQDHTPVLTMARRDPSTS